MPGPQALALARKREQESSRKGPASRRAEGQEAAIVFRLLDKGLDLRRIVVRTRIPPSASGPFTANGHARSSRGLPRLTMHSATAPSSMPSQRPPWTSLPARSETARLLRDSHPVAILTRISLANFPRIAMAVYTRPPSPEACLVHSRQARFHGGCPSAARHSFEGTHEGTDACVTLGRVVCATFSQQQRTMPRRRRIVRPLR